MHEEKEEDKMMVEEEWCRSEMKVHFFLGSKVSSRRGGRGPPPCSPAATGSHPPVPYVIRVTYGRV